MYPIALWGSVNPFQTRSIFKNVKDGSIGYQTLGVMAASQTRKQSAYDVVILHSDTDY